MTEFYLKLSEKMKTQVQTSKEETSCGQIKKEMKMTKSFEKDLSHFLSVDLCGDV